MSRKSTTWLLSGGTRAGWVGPMSTMTYCCSTLAGTDDQHDLVLGEIIERSHADGVTDNTWSGLDRARICYCVNLAGEMA